MTKKLQIFSLILVPVLVALYIVFHFYVKSSIKNYLNNTLSKDFNIQYEDFNLNVFKGSVHFDNVIFETKTIHSDKPAIILKLKTLSVENFKYINYLITKNIDVSAIKLKQPEIKYYKKPSKPHSKPLKNLKNILKIGTFDVSKAQFKMFNTETDSLLLSSDNFNFQLKNIELNNETLKSKIPLKYKDYHVSFDSFFYKMNAFDNLKIGHSEITSKNMDLDTFKIYTKHSKLSLSKHLLIERDHANLICDKIEINNYDFGLKNDTLFYFNSPKISIKKPSLDLFTDKLVANKRSFKPLYSRLLRELKFSLAIDEVEINEGDLTYSERVKNNNFDGKITFSKLNANLQNLGNTYKNVKTTINIEANFMKQAPIKAFWNFDVNDLNDHFNFSAKISNLKVRDINEFSEPNLNLQFQGAIDELDFNIVRNNMKSNIDLKIKYENLKIEPLRKDHKTINILESKLISLFIFNKSETNKFRESHKEGIIRDPSKSFFSFVWLNTKTGLFDALTNRNASSHKKPS
ncbi:DUF748 domain-containing protein [Siansivirga zeaxanthinifaciens]|uniref:DUF748 domain-containing protein n=1 Tax=Siansivirga zeaxanthinifaciens CC-SAMT-1 TaxID=1454006 RepID=A0A0C5WIE2_9FLAO|nr:DUF748 domain-containing protein [Siansivirga zeaxanthinifaciens]AJR04934.1 hypothetical protein AW14_11545 [Siansivirga zeaxanthinifaciens CC-SAMT-1]